MTAGRRVVCAGRARLGNNSTCSDFDIFIFLCVRKVLDCELCKALRVWMSGWLRQAQQTQKYLQALEDAAQLAAAWPFGAVGREY